MHFFFKILKSKYGECTQIEQEWTLINGHINNWTRTLDNYLMCDTRPIVKDTFAHTNTSMILGSCELLSFFFIFSVTVLTQKQYIYFGIYYLYLGYARIWNTIKIEIIVKWQTRMSLEPHPYPTPEIFSDPIRARCNLSCSIAYRFQYSTKFKNNHILTALW